MTGFKSLFKQMFKQKSRYAYLVLLVQTFAVIFMFLVGLITKNNSLAVSGNDNALTMWDIILLHGAWTTVIGDLVFLGLLCWQNEKINLSQTWQLIPCSSIKIWLTNVFSSLVECAYIFIIQAVIGLVVSLIDCFSYKMPLSKFIGPVRFSWGDVQGTVEVGLYIASICLIVFVFVSFANLLTRAIIDQLPVKNTLGIKIFVMAILVIIAVLIAARFNDQATIMYTKRMMKGNSEGSVDLIAFAIYEYIGGSIILGIIDALLIQKFVEPKIRG